MAHFDPADDVSDLARALGHTRETWEAAGHFYAPYSDRFFRNRYDPTPIGPPQPQIVAASAAPAAPKETAAVAPDGCFIVNTRADAVLRLWCAPIAAGRSAASKPLLVIGQSIWPNVTKALRELGAYPSAYDRLDLNEFPRSDQSLAAFRANSAYSRVIMVSMPSLDMAAAFTQSTLTTDGIQPPALDRIQSWAPQHRFAYFAAWSPEVDLDHLPSVLWERYHILTWRDTHAPAVQPEAPSIVLQDQFERMRTVEASHLRKGGTVGLGLTPGQRLGLETLSFRDASRAAMLEETAQRAKFYNAMDGDVRDAKRVKTSHFARGNGIVTTKDHAHFGDHTIA